MNPRSSESQPLKILIADDSGFVRGKVVEFAKLAPIPIQFMETDNGKDCLNALTQGVYQIAFIDVFMPQLNGLEALARSRQDGNDTFVVLMSSVVDQERFKIARALNAYDYLTKPFKPEDIINIINNYLLFQRRSSVLIVDDSSTVRKLVSKVIDGSIFNLVSEEAENGEEALAKYRDRKHDVVFLDVNMPGMDGIEVLRQLKKIEPGVRIVLISGEKSENMNEKISSLGKPHFLNKPFNARDVDRILHEVFKIRASALAV